MSKNLQDCLKLAKGYEGMETHDQTVNKVLEEVRDIVIELNSLRVKVGENPIEMNGLEPNGSDIVHNEYQGFKLVTREISPDHYITYGEDKNGNKVSAESKPGDELMSMEKVQKMIDQLRVEQPKQVDVDRNSWTDIENQVWDVILSQNKGSVERNQKEAKENNKNLLAQGLVYIDSFGSGSSVTIRLNEKGKQFAEQEKNRKNALANLTKDRGAIIPSKDEVGIGYEFEINGTPFVIDKIEARGIVVRQNTEKRSPVNRIIPYDEFTKLTGKTVQRVTNVISPKVIDKINPRLQQRVNYGEEGILTKQEFIDKRIAEGWEPVIERDATYPGDSGRTPITSQEQEDSLIKAGYKVRDYYILRNNSNSITWDISKLEYDYAKSIYNERQSINNVPGADQNIPEGKSPGNLQGPEAQPQLRSNSGEQGQKLPGENGNVGKPGTGQGGVSAGNANIPVEKENILKRLRDAKNNLGGSGFAFDPKEEAKKELEFLEAAIDAMKYYISTGVKRFKEIVEDIVENIGELTDQMMKSLKRAYLGQSAYTDGLDDVQSVRDYKYVKPEPEKEDLSFNKESKYKGNLNAIRLITQLAKENRSATDEEKSVLSKYSGYGGLKEIGFIPTVDEQWKPSTEKYRSIVAETIDAIHEFEKAIGVNPDSALRNVRAGILNAHYTPVEVIKSMYDGLSKLGFEHGRILDPSAGIGAFISNMDDNMQRNSHITAVEKDVVTGTILKHIIDADVKVSPIEQAMIPKDSYDLVISNIPFGAYSIADNSYTGDKRSFLKRIHKYFFAKALDSTREGGIVAFVTSTGLLDSKGNEDIRKYILENSRFLGAVRLPNSTFKAKAGTEVVTDIIFLQKKSPEDIVENPDLSIGTKMVEDKDGDPGQVSINQYFIDNPEAVVGKLVRGKNLYKEADDAITVEGDINDLPAAINKVLPALVYEHKMYDKPLSGNNHESIKEGNLAIIDGEIVQKLYNEVSQPKLPSYVKMEDVERYIKLRNALNDLIYSEYSGESDQSVEQKRELLNNVYDSIIREYKTKEKFKAIAKLMEIDGDGYGVMALRTATGEKADIFTKRTVNPIQHIDKAENIDDAIVISLSESATVDIERIAHLLGVTKSEAIDLGKGKIYELPSGGFVSAEEYLSGNVKKKLAEVEEAINNGRTDLIFNKESLEAVIPKDIPAHEIEVRLGSRWIPVDVFDRFAKDILKTEVTVKYSSVLDQYMVDGYAQSVESKNVYGISYISMGSGRVVERSGLKTLHDALHIASPVITYTDDFKKTHIDKKATEMAVAKYEQIREAFNDWVYKDSERRERLQRIYNDKFNTSVKRKYNGSHLDFPGMSGVSLMEHQSSAVWMLMLNNGGIIDHIVGAGKTYIMVAAAMEMRRTGISNKPTILALKSTIPQITAAFKKAYPLAKILAPTEKEFDSKNRRKLFAKIANNDWDCVILSHENYGKIPHEREYVIETAENEIRELEAERYNITDKRALAGLQKRIENLQKKIAELLSMPKDNTTTFQQMGIDHVMVDESQQFKNLAYVTKQRGIAGLGDPIGSKRAFDLLTGIRYLQNKHGADKGVTFLSGTPISNSMVEMYLLLKYMRPIKLSELGFSSLDSWATTFASPSVEVEFTVTGQFKARNRFREFINVPELSMLYTEIADVRTDDNLDLDKPKMKGGKYTPVIVEMDDEQKKFAIDIINFAKTGNGDLVGVVTDDKSPIMLLATDLAGKMAIDMRLIDKKHKYNPNGKIGTCVKNIVKDYNNSNEYKGTQLVFCDIGTPKDVTSKSSLLKDYMEDELGASPDTIVEIFGDTTLENYKYPSIADVTKKLKSVLEMTDEDIEKMIESSKSSVGKFSVYDEVKLRLIESGIPEDQIAFIHSYKTQKQKDDLYLKVQNGDIRVVLGSTQKLGTGVNVQNRVVAIHHLDAKWRPSDMDQRDGRGLRQGNWVAKKYLNNEIPVYAYATELTLDAMKYALIAIKKKFLTQVKDGTVAERVLREDGGDDAVGLAEMVSALTGNQDVVLKMKLDRQKDKLQRAKKSFEGQLHNAESEIKKSDSLIKYYDDQIAASKVNKDLYSNLEYDENGKFVIHTINGKSIPDTVVKNEKTGEEKIEPAKRTDYAKEAIGIITTKILEGKSGQQPLFTLNDNITIVGERYQSSLGGSPTMALSLVTPNGVSESLSMSDVPGILLNNIQGAIDRVSNASSGYQLKKERLLKDIESHKEILKTTEFPKQEELNKVIADLAEVDKRLNDLAKESEEEEVTGIGEGGQGMKADGVEQIENFDPTKKISVVKGVRNNGNEVFLLRINEKLDYQTEYAHIVKPLIEKYDGTWSTKLKAIIFNSSNDAYRFKNEVDDKFNWDIVFDYDVTREDSDDDIVQFMASTDPVAKAEAAYKAAKTAYDKKRKELYGKVMEDQTDLFGERKSAANSLFGGETEKADASNVKAILEPLKKKMDNALADLEKARKDSQSQGTLFKKGAPAISTITEEAFDGLISQLKKAYPDVSVFHDEETLKAKLKEFGHSIPEFLAAFKDGKDIDGIKFMSTPAGVIYGATFPDGSMYLNREFLNANAPIHEFSHVWEKYNPTGWKEGVRIIQASPEGKKVFDEIRKNGAYANKSEEEQWSEALNTFIGRKGEERFKDKTLIKRFAEWLKRFFGRIFSKLRKGGLSDAKLHEFASKVIGDLLGGKPVVNEFDAKPGGTDLMMSRAIKEAKDIQLVKDKAGNLLAPNGKKSNLNETQWKIVRTTAFKDWFGDWENEPEKASKVVDENGEPLVLYHGTNANFGNFDSKFTKGGAERVHKFATNKEAAKGYGDNIIEAFLRIDNKERGTKWQSKKGLATWQMGGKTFDKARLDLVYESKKSDEANGGVIKNVRSNDGKMDMDVYYTADADNIFSFTKFGKKVGVSSTQHSIDITPELKAQVSEGLPLFMAKGGRNVSDDVNFSPAQMSSGLKELYNKNYPEDDGFVENDHLQEMYEKGEADFIQLTDTQGVYTLPKESNPVFPSLNGGIEDARKALQADSEIVGKGIAKPSFYSKDGEAVTFYHGTRSRDKKIILSPSSAQQFGKGIYFSSSKDGVVDFADGGQTIEANLPANMIDLTTNEGNNLYFSIKEDVEDETGIQQEDDNFPMSKVNDKLKELGYKGIIHQNDVYGGLEAMVFDAKSVHYKDGRQNEGPKLMFATSDNELRNLYSDLEDLGLIDSIKSAVTKGVSRSSVEQKLNQLESNYVIDEAEKEKALELFDRLKNEANQQNTPPPPPPPPNTPPGNQPINDWDDPEISKMANWFNDAQMRNMLGTDQLDYILGQLQDTDTTEIYENAKDGIRSDNDLPRKTRERILMQRTGTARDQAILLYDIAQLKGMEASIMKDIMKISGLTNFEFDKYKMLNGLPKSTTKEQLISSKHTAMRFVQDQISDNWMANRYIGREASNIFRIRKLYSDSNMDLITMQNQYMASKGLEELTDDQMSEINSHYMKIRELQVKRDMIREELDKEIAEKNQLAAENEALKKIIEQSNKTTRPKQHPASHPTSPSSTSPTSRTRIDAAKSALLSIFGKSNVQFMATTSPSLHEALMDIAQEYFYLGKTTFPEIVSAVFDEVDPLNLNLTIDDIRQNLLYYARNEIREYYAKNGTHTDKSLNEKFDSYKQIQKEFAMAVFQWQKERRYDISNDMTTKQKIIDYALRYQRFAILSYPTTLVKLAAVVGHQLVLKPFKVAATYLLGNVTKMVSPDLYRKQAIWGGHDFPTMVKALGIFYAKFFKNFSLHVFSEHFKGIDTKDIMYGRGLLEYDEWSSKRGILEMPGRSHGYIKSFLKNPEFEFAHYLITTKYINRMLELQDKLIDPTLTKLEKQSLKAQFDLIDITRDDVMDRVNTMSLNHGRWAIMMQDNKMAQQLAKFTNKLEIFPAIVKSEMPIVKLPLNYIKRYFLYKIGAIQAITGIPRWMSSGPDLISQDASYPGIIQMVMNGTDDMTDEQAELFGKTLVLGSIGLALFVLGYIKWKDVERDEEDDSVTAFGEKISKYLLHSPEIEIMMSGAQTGRKYNEGDDYSASSWIYQYVYSDLHVMKYNPFISMLDYGLIPNAAEIIHKDLLEDQVKQNLARAAGKKVANMLIPGFIKQPAQWLDTDVPGMHPFGDPIPRYPKGDWKDIMIQSFQMSIPGQRDEVPQYYPRRINKFE